MSPEIERAVITNNGKLTNRFTYIQKLREEKKKFKALKSKNSFRDE